MEKKRLYLAELAHLPALPPPSSPSFSSNESLLCSGDSACVVLCSESVISLSPSLYLSFWYEVVPLIQGCHTGNYPADKQAATVLPAVRYTLRNLLLYQNC